MLAFRVREELEQFGDGDCDAVVARTSVRIFRLVLAVLRGTEFVLVCLFFLTFNRVLNDLPDAAGAVIQEKNESDCS